MTKSFSVTATPWVYPGKAGWVFLTIPPETTKDINFYFEHSKKGWGSLPVNVTLGKTKWKTSIFPDKKTDSYLLPLKAKVRAEEHISDEKPVSFSIEISD